MEKPTPKPLTKGEALELVEALADTVPRDVSQRDIQRALPALAIIARALRDDVYRLENANDDDQESVAALRGELDALRTEVLAFREVGRELTESGLLDRLRALDERDRNTDEVLPVERDMGGEQRSET